METDKGTCQKHGEFLLTEGCPECLAERQELETGRAEQEPGSMESEEGLSQSDYTIKTLVNVKPEENTEVMSLYSQCEDALRYADARVIARVEDLKPATDDLALIRKLKKALEEKRKEYLDPLEQHKKEIRVAFDWLMSPVIKADEITARKMMAFKIEQDRKRAEAEAIARKQAELAERAKQLTGEIIEQAPVPVVEEAPRRVFSEYGSESRTRANWKVEVVDFALLPNEYKIVDQAKLNKVVRAGLREVLGCRIWNEPILEVR